MRSTTYHTPIKLGAPTTVATINNPLGEIDSAIGALVAGTNDLLELSFEKGETLVIENNTITTPNIIHLIDINSELSNDELHTINHVDGIDFLLLRIVSENRTITIKHNSGNITTLDAKDKLLDKFYKIAFLVWDNASSIWRLINPTGDLNEILYSASDSTDWTDFGTEPTTIQSALDELALELGTGELIYNPTTSTDWSSVPTNFKDALNELAERVQSTEKGCIVYNNANIAIPDITWTSLTFNTEESDENSWHSTSTNTSRITIDEDGTYLVQSRLEWANITTGIRKARVIKNGTTRISETSLPNFIATSPFPHNVGGMVKAVSGDYFEVQVYQSSGGNLNIIYTANRNPYFSVVKIGETS